MVIAAGAILKGTVCQRAPSRVLVRRFAMIRMGFSIALCGVGTLTGWLGARTGLVLIHPL